VATELGVENIAVSFKEKHKRKMRKRNLKKNEEANGSKGKNRTYWYVIIHILVIQ
jgi:hypothetical protein